MGLDRRGSGWLSRAPAIVAEAGDRLATCGFGFVVPEIARDLMS